MSTMTKNNTNKKSSASRKLIPAIGMLTASAMMLSSATYAWFTMSKEVSLTGIQMTASTPEDIQISLGLGTNSASTQLYSAGTTAAAFTSNASNVGDPSEEQGSTDWTNTIAVGDYYAFGYLTPATSINGLNIYYTSESTGVGQTLREDVAGSGGYGVTGVSTFAAATAAEAGIADPSADGALAAADDKTGGKYYIDIPVWFRTSVVGSGTVDLAVVATFSDPNTDNGDPSIVQAARVALLSTGQTSTSAGVICDSGTQYYHSGATANSVVTPTLADTSVYASNAWATNVATINAATNNDANTWGIVDFVKQATSTSITSDGLAAATDDTVVSVPMATTAGGKYGDMVEYTLRIWLEGEDVNCWNETAAQDFQIDLRFVRKAAAQQGGN